jgi:hypothetical protein
MATREFVVHVGGPPPTWRELASEVGNVLLAVPMFIASPLLRRWHQRWGATRNEIAEPLPGDSLVPGCQYTITRAITINAPPDKVWPWLVQVGFGKAGFYAYDLLDNVAHPSADHIIPECQALHVGDWVPMFAVVNDSTAFRVAAFEAEHYLLWTKADSTWVWQLTSRYGRTRLVTRLRSQYRWQRPAEAILSLFLNEFGDFPMMRRMLRTIKQRAEGPAATPVTRPVPVTRPAPVLLPM